MDDQKRLKLANLMEEYTQMGEEIHRLGVDLGIEETGRPAIYRHEFEAILNPAGFYVLDIHKIESGNLDEFMVRLGRRGRGC